MVSDKLRAISQAKFLKKIKTFWARLTSRNPWSLSARDQADFLERLETFYEQASKEKKALFNRSLPFGEYVVDRWARAAALGFGAGTSIYDSATVIGDVTVGKNTWIGPNVMLDGSGKLAVGDNCSLSCNVQIYSHDSVEWATSGGKAPYVYAETTVGDNCYIGPNSVLTKGVTLGAGCVVGANSYVNKSFAAGSRLAGSPAQAKESR